MKIRKMNEAFVAFWSTLILICQTSRITLCGKSCDLERKYVVFATPVSQKRRCQPISFILDSLSSQMNVPDNKFSRNTMKLLNHNASTLKHHRSGTMKHYWIFPFHSREARTRDRNLPAWDSSCAVSCSTSVILH